MTDPSELTKFDSLALPVSIGWVLLAVAGFAYGTLVFYYMVRLPAWVKRGPWYILAFGMTGWGVSRIGWLFSVDETAHNLWGPLALICGSSALVGNIVATLSFARSIVVHSLTCPLCRYSYRCECSRTDSGVNLASVPE